MSKESNQKLKLMYLAKILLENTDDNHGLTRAELVNELAQYNISAERKSIYSDLAALKLFGLDIMSEQRDRTVYYFIGSRQFELAELKLLVDAVQSSKFITEKKSRQLIKKIEGFTSKYEAKELQRQVYIQGRIKTKNESIYYIVDTIHRAIDRDVQIEFQYFQWNVEKEMELRHDGVFYQISPWELVWDDENYYLVGYDCKAEMIKHFRVDKMLNVGLINRKRENKILFNRDDKASYSEKRFGMFDGKIQMVKLECENQFVGVIIDYFGKDVCLRKIDDNHFCVNVEIAISDQFFGWIISLGDGVKIIAPENIVDEMRRVIKRLIKQYGELVHEIE